MLSQEKMLLTEFIMYINIYIHYHCVN